MSVSAADYLRAAADRLDTAERYAEKKSFALQKRKEAATLVATASIMLHRIIGDDE